MILVLNSLTAAIWSGCYSAVSDLFMRTQQMEWYAVSLRRFEIQSKYSDEFCSSDFFWNISINSLLDLKKRKVRD